LPRSQLSLRSTGGARDNLKWKWKFGGQTDVADFGDPTATTNYTLCVYGLIPSPFFPPWGLQSDASIPAGLTCAASPCWRATGKGTGTGFKYKDRDATSDGIGMVSLRAGSDGKAKIVVGGKGPNLNMPSSLFLGEEEVLAQLRASNGQCWEAHYFMPKKATDSEYKATDGQ
jgi:hypothetical protein